MSSKKKTAFANLTQYISSDTISYIEDYNSDMSKIDNELSKIDAKKCAAVVIGHKNSGYNERDVDFLCDGTMQNDSEQIFDAISAVGALPNGGKVIILEGTYNVGLEIFVKSGVAIEGMGSKTILKSAAMGTGGTMITLSSNSSIRDICIDGNHQPMYGIKGGGDKITIQNVRLQKMVYGIDLQNITDSMIINNYLDTQDRLGGGIKFSGSNNVITNNKVRTYSTGGAGIGIHCTGGNNNTISFNYCYENSVGIKYDASTASNGSTIIGNICVDCIQDGININALIGSTIDGNTCHRNNLRGIYVHSSACNNTITGNSCMNNTTGIYLQSSERNTISGNTCIYNNGDESIPGDYRNSDGVLIRHTVYLTSDTKNNLICGNTLLGNAHYISGESNLFANNLTGRIVDDFTIYALAPDEEIRDANSVSDGTVTYSSEYGKATIQIAADSSFAGGGKYIAYNKSSSLKFNNSKNSSVLYTVAEGLLNGKVTKLIYNAVSSNGQWSTGINADVTYGDNQTITVTLLPYGYWSGVVAGDVRAIEIGSYPNVKSVKIYATGEGTVFYNSIDFNII